MLFGGDCCRAWVADSYATHAFVVFIQNSDWFPAADETAVDRLLKSAMYQP